MKNKLRRASMKSTWRMWSTRNNRISSQRPLRFDIPLVGHPYYLLYLTLLVVGTRNALLLEYRFNALISFLSSLALIVQSIPLTSSVAT